MKQVQKREEAGAVATTMFEADANAGSQNMTQEDLALPFLKVLGQLSPEVIYILSQVRYPLPTCSARCSGKYGSRNYF